MADEMKREVTGVISMSVSEESDCICCPAGHVYGAGVEVPEYDFAWPYLKFPAHVGDVGNDFVRLVRGVLGYDAHGRRVRVTFELLPVTDEASDLLLLLDD
jgi:hypothetical protein